MEENTGNRYKIFLIVAGIYIFGKKN